MQRYRMDFFSYINAEAIRNIGYLLNNQNLNSMKNLLKRMPAATMASVYLKNIISDQRRYGLVEKNERLIVKLDSYASVNDAQNMQFDDIIKGVMMEIENAPKIVVHPKEGTDFHIHFVSGWFEDYFPKYIIMQNNAIIDAAYSIIHFALDPSIVYESRVAIASFINEMEKRTNDSQYDWKRIVTAKTDEELEAAEDKHLKLQQEKKEDKLS